MRIGMFLCSGVMVFVAGCSGPAPEPDQNLKKTVTAMNAVAFEGDQIEFEEFEKQFKEMSLAFKEAEKTAPGYDDVGKILKLYAGANEALDQMRDYKSAQARLTELNAPFEDIARAAEKFGIAVTKFQESLNAAKDAVDALEL